MAVFPAYRRTGLSGGGRGVEFVLHILLRSCVALREAQGGNADVRFFDLLPFRIVRHADGCAFVACYYRWIAISEHEKHTEEERLRRRRGRNWALFAFLGGFVAIVYAITIVKIKLGYG